MNTFFHLLFTNYTPESSNVMGSLDDPHLISIYTYEVHIKYVKKKKKGYGEGEISHLNKNKDFPGSLVVKTLHFHC